MKTETPIDLTEEWLSSQEARAELCESVTLPGGQWRGILAELRAHRVSRTPDTSLVGKLEALKTIEAYDGSRLSSGFEYVEAIDDAIAVVQQHRTPGREAHICAGIERADGTAECPICGITLLPSEIPEKTPPAKESTELNRLNPSRASLPPTTVQRGARRAENGTAAQETAPIPTHGNGESMAYPETGSAGTRDEQPFQKTAAALSLQQILTWRYWAKAASEAKTLADAHLYGKQVLNHIDNELATPTRERESSKEPEECWCGAKAEYACTFHTPHPHCIHRRRGS